MVGRGTGRQTEEKEANCVYIQSAIISLAKTRNKLANQFCHTCGGPRVDGVHWGRGLTVHQGRMSPEQISMGFDASNTDIHVHVYE